MIQRLIEILHDLAASLFECHTVGGRWDLADPATAKAHRDHQEALEIIRTLSAYTVRGAQTLEHLCWAEEMHRLRAIQAAATQALKLAQAGEAMAAYDALHAVLGDGQ